MKIATQVAGMLLTGHHQTTTLEFGISDALHRSLVVHLNASVLIRSSAWSIFTIVSVGQSSQASGHSPTIFFVCAG